MLLIIDFRISKSVILDIMTVLLPRTTQALITFGEMIRAGRIARRWSQQGLAERLGTSRFTLSKIESGDPSVAIGTVFEAASLVGIPLLGDTQDQRASHARAVTAEVALLPSRVRERIVDDDF